MFHLDYISPKWQSLIGASHDEIFSLWRYDEVAPEHMKQDVSLNAGKIQPQNIQGFLKENVSRISRKISFLENFWSLKAEFKIKN